MFRVIIRNSLGAVCGATQPIGFVDAAMFKKFMVQRGWHCSLMPSTKSLDKQLARFAVDYPAPGNDVPGHDAAECAAK
jgi:hypothetical protein